MVGDKALKAVFPNAEADISINGELFAKIQGVVKEHNIHPVTVRSIYDEQGRSDENPATDDQGHPTREIIVEGYKEKNAEISERYVVRFDEEHPSKAIIDWKKGEDAE